MLRRAQGVGFLRDASTTADTSRESNRKQASASADNHAEEQRTTLTTCSCKAVKGTVSTTTAPLLSTVPHHYCPPPLQSVWAGPLEGAAVLFNAAEAAARITVTREILHSMRARRRGRHVGRRLQHAGDARPLGQTLSPAAYGAAQRSGQGALRSRADVTLTAGAACSLRY